jgi:ribosomal-protein-serine acetyltransferase
MGLFSFKCKRLELYQEGGRRNSPCRANGIGHIGYWLGQEFTGKGIMTLAVKDLICQGFKNWPLQKVEIRCAVGNKKSRAIPERLGFQNEGTLRNAEKVYDKYNDHIVYGKLKEEIFC